VDLGTVLDRTQPDPLIPKPNPLPGRPSTRGRTSSGFRHYPTRAAFGRPDPSGRHPPFGRCSPSGPKPTSGFSRRHPGVTRQSRHPYGLAAHRGAFPPNQGRHCVPPGARFPGEPEPGLRLLRCPRSRQDFCVCMGSQTPVSRIAAGALALSYDGSRNLRGRILTIVRWAFGPPNAMHPLCFAMLPATPPDFGIRPLQTGSLRPGPRPEPLVLPVALAR